MASLQEQRRAIAEGMARSRAATGEAQRKAAGDAMIEQRTGRSVVKDINRLTRPRPQRKPLPSIEPVGAVPASRGRGDYKAPLPSSSTGGIAGPLEEVSRTYATDPEYIETIDGSGYFKVRRVASITMVDANGNEVEFTYLQAPPII